MQRDLSKQTHTRNKQIAQCRGSFHKNINTCSSLQSDFGLQSWNLSQSWQLGLLPQSQSSVLRRWGRLWLVVFEMVFGKRHVGRRKLFYLPSYVSYGSLMFFFVLFFIFQFLVYDTNIWLSVFYSSVYIQQVCGVQEMVSDPLGTEWSYRQL